jgi:hypothetical protein
MAHESLMPPDVGEWDLASLQALPIPRANSRQIRFEDLDEALNEEYVQHFLPPRANRSNTALACAGCGENLTGMFGTFTFGLAWGEGACGKCRYPARAMHKIGDGVCELVLQYHPDELEVSRG